VSAALIGACTLLVIFTFPETMYRRDGVAKLNTTPADTTKLEVDAKGVSERRNEGDTEKAPAGNGRYDHLEKRSYVSSLGLFSGTYTKESLWKLFVRPVVLLALPSVLWATLVMAGTIGFLVAITSNFAPAFQQAYNFQPWQSGLCFIAALIGAFIGIFIGGNLSDWIADRQTLRNGGIREPEMRLPAISISIITAPLALVLYGVGINNQLHWICPTIGLALSQIPTMQSSFVPVANMRSVNFSIVQATNISLVYVIDSYRPVAGELVVTQMAFKSAFGFLLSFYTNPWVQQSGYSNAYGAMAGISGSLLLLFVPFYIFGRTIRAKTWEWALIRKFVHWEDDREVGE
jgi:hypothetical protein